MSDKDVFISYSSKNINIAQAVVEDFESHNIKCWYAPRDVEPGKEWVSAITEALEKTKILVLIYTEESNESRQVMNEIALQFNANKPIVPFRISDVAMSREIGYYLTRVHWFDATDKPLSKAIAELRDYVIGALNGKVDLSVNYSTTSHQKEENKKIFKIFWAVVLCVLAFSLIGTLASTVFGELRGQKNPEPTVVETPEPTEIETPPEKPDPKVVTADYLKNKELNEELTVEEMETLGKMYYYGNTTMQDYTNAHYYLLKAYDYGDVSAETCVLLGDCYYNGQGTSSNELKAKEFYVAALEKGYEDTSIYNTLGMICYVRNDYSEAAEFFAKGGELGTDSMVMGNAGIAYYENGDYAKALYWFGQAIDNDADYSNDYKTRIKKMVSDGKIKEEDAAKWLN